MRIVLFSASSLGAALIRQIGEMPNLKMVGILTLPEKFRISYAGTQPIKNVLHTDFTAIGKSRNIPTAIMKGDMKDPQIFSIVGHWRPDFIIVAGWYHMVPASIRSIPPRGIAGLHGSLLPRYRGGAPLVWAMIRGETETGMTLFYLSSGIDNGDIIGQKAFRIREEDTIESLRHRSQISAVALISEYLPLIARGTAPRIPQNEEDAFSMPQRSPDDGRIDWNQDASTLYDFVRAQTHPYPGAFFHRQGIDIRIWTSRPADWESTGLPGEVLAVEPNLVIGTASNSSLILESLGTSEGEWAGTDLARTLGIRVGERLG